MDHALSDDDKKKLQDAVDVLNRQLHHDQSASCSQSQNVPGPSTSYSQLPGPSTSYSQLPGPTTSYSQSPGPTTGGVGQPRWQRFDDAYRSAISSLRAFRGSSSAREHRDNFRSSRSSLGKRASKCSPWTHTFYCLANHTQVRVPTTPSDKRTLFEAGLGEKKVTIADVDCTTKEFFEMIQDHFPKLRGAGGFDLLRCIANTRDLEKIPAPTCHSPRLLKSQAGCGRIYIRPIQSDLGLEPVVQHDQMNHSNVMEKCLTCGKEVPIESLREHVGSCKTRDNFPNGADLDIEQEMMDEAIQQSLNDTQQPESPNEQFEQVRDIVVALQKKHQITLEFDDETYEPLCQNIVDFNVRRRRFITDVFRECRKPYFDETKLLQVHFVGEEAVDTGGPRREFWRLLVLLAKEHFCCGKEGCQTFDHNTLFLRRSDFLILGKLVSMSILQGGIGFPVLSPAVLDYMVTGQYLLHAIPDEFVPNQLAVEMLSQISMAQSDDEFKNVFFATEEFTTALLETGYSRPIISLTLLDRPTIQDCVRYHYTVTRSKAEIDQFCEGLQSLDVLATLKKFPNLMRPYFVADTDVVLSARTITSLLKSVFSPRGTSVREQEESAFIMFIDFLDECERGEIKTESDGDLKLGDILAFFTGLDRIPPGGFDTHFTIAFHEDDKSKCLATASTCDMRLYLPTCHHEDSQSFHSALLLSFLGHDGFGQV